MKITRRQLRRLILEQTKPFDPDDVHGYWEGDAEEKVDELLRIVSNISPSGESWEDDLSALEERLNKRIDDLEEATLGARVAASGGSGGAQAAKTEEPLPESRRRKRSKK